MKVLGRDDELGRLRAAVDAASDGRGGVVILRGEAGIGKSTVLRRVRRHALASGHVVRTGRATELETDVPYAMLRAADLGVRGEDVGGDHGLPAWQVADSLRDHLTQLAAGGPFTVLLDDVHWADPASLDVLAVLLSRPPQNPGALLLAARPGPTTDALVRMATSGPRRCEVVDLGPLGEADAAALLMDLGLRGDPAAIIHASGGNPLLLAELAAHTGRDTPPAVTGIVQRELAACSPAAQALIEAGCLLGDPFDPALAASLAGLDEPSTRAAVDELTSRRLLVAEPRGPLLRFRHPVVRSAVHDAVPVGHRRSLHRSAAAVLTRAGAPPAAIARHLVHVAAAGDQETGRALVAAAQQVAHRSPATAADWYLAAAQCDPRLGDEHWSDTFTALVQAGRAQDALQRAEDQLHSSPGAPDPHTVLLCAALERVLGRVHASERRLQALDPATLTGPAHASWLAALAASAFYAGDFERVGPLARQALNRRREPTAAVLSAEAHALAAMMQRSQGDTAAADGLADRARRLIDLASDQELLTDAEAGAVVPWTLVQIDRFDDVIEIARRGARVTRDAGNAVATVPFALAEVLALALTGRLDDAAALGDQVCAEARTTRLDQPLQWALWLQAWVLAEVDEIPRAVRMAREAWAVSERLEPSVLTTNARSVYGSCLILGGEPERGVPLLALHDEPGWICRWAPRLVEGLLALGDVAAAQAHARMVADTSRAMGLGSTEVGASQAVTLVTLAEGDSSAGVARAGEAVVAARRAGLPVEHARATGLLAAAQEAAGSDTAIDTWRAAQQLARRCGAVRLDREFGRAVRRLTRGRARRASADEDRLSTRQAEVAALVADGLTNREIATRLFLSEKTVEAHVSAVLAKVGVTSRAGLAGLMAGRDL